MVLQGSPAVALGLNIAANRACAGLVYVWDKERLCFPAC